LELPWRFVVFHGLNGHGKTNALEAIHLLCTLKGLRSHRIRETICWDSERATVGAQIRVEAIQRHYRVDLDSSGRTAILDGKRVSSLGDYFDGIRCVSFVPDHGSIVSGQPAGRRRWLDRAAFTRSMAHLNSVRCYERCRRQKSAALKDGTFNSQLLDTYDAQLAQHGADVIRRRIAILNELTPHIQALHDKVAGAPASIRLSYRSTLDMDADNFAEQLVQQSHRSRSEEIRRRSVLVGPQRDDVHILLNDHPARSYGSRGQIRSIVLALKLAELLAAYDRGTSPLFLLDDLSSELDSERTKRLVALLKQLNTQVFISTTDPDHLSSLPAEETVFIHVDCGRLVLESGLGAS